MVYYSNEHCVGAVMPLCHIQTVISNNQLRRETRESRDCTQVAKLGYFIPVYI